MGRFQQWFLGEKEKLRTLSPGDKVGYIWDYYKLWIIGVLSAVILATAAAVHLHNTLAENWFYACFANTYADLGSDSTFCKDYARYAGYDLSEKNLQFNAQCYCKPSENTYGNSYYETLITLMDSGTLDVLIMEEEDVLAIGSSGRLLDLEDERLSSVLEHYQDRLVYCEPFKEGYGKELVPVGIDLSGTALVGEYRAYPEGCVLGISAIAPHLDQVEVFLTYLFEEAEL